MTAWSAIWSGLPAAELAWLDRALADDARGAIIIGGGGRVGVGAALDEGFAVVEQVAVGGVLEQDLERLGSGRVLDDAGEDGLSVLVGDEVEGHGLRGVEA